MKVRHVQTDVCKQMHVNRCMYKQMQARHVQTDAKSLHLFVHALLEDIVEGKLNQQN